MMGPIDLYADLQERAQIKDAIIREMATAMGLLGAGHDLLCVVCSHGDTMTDEEVLREVRSWNTQVEKETGVDG